VRDYLAWRLAFGVTTPSTNIDYPTALHREAELLVHASRTADHKEAVQAFVEKRKPVFVGK
jgi:enoyl-CoA hydratase/carnithine racemase